VLNVMDWGFLHHAIQRLIGQRIWDAADGGDAGTLGSLLRHPKLTEADVNYSSVGQRDFPLWRAVDRGDLACVRILLAHPLVDVNRRNVTGSTVLHLACGKVSEANEVWVAIVRALCLRHDVELDVMDQDNCSPLWVACWHDGLQAVKLLLACARVGGLDLATRSRDKFRAVRTIPSGWDNLSAFQVATDTEIRELIIAYSQHPLSVRRSLRQEYGLLSRDIAFDFASTVLYSDG